MLKLHHCGINMRITLFTIVTILLVSSCSDKTIGLNCVPIVLDSTDTTSISFDDCFEVLSYIPLEENEEGYISSVRRIEYFDGHYYIGSSNANVGLLVFDRTGKFVRRIGRKGNGYGEYTNIYDFSIDRKNRRVLMFCNRSSLIKVYSLDGEFQNEVILHNTSLNDLACINGLILCSTNHQGFTREQEDSLFYIFDENFRFVKKHTYISDNSIGMSSCMPASIRTYSNRFVYSDFHEHRLFVLNRHGEVETCLEYEKDKLIPLSALKTPKLFVKNQFEYDFIFGSAILGDKCITAYKENKQMKLSINKINGDCILNRPLSTLLPDFMGYDDNSFLSIVSAEYLKSLNVKLLLDNHVGVNYYIIKYRLKNG